MHVIRTNLIISLISCTSVWCCFKSMAENFSNEDKLDMLEMYFQAHRNSVEASRLYQEHFPERPQPNQRYFRKLIINLLNFGSFESKRAQHYDIADEEEEPAILNLVQDNPSTSVREISRELNIPKTKVHRILRGRKYHPYKFTIVQGLQQHDFGRRVRYCQWYIDKCLEDPRFPSRVLWTDETRFSNCGVFNKHNTHVWSIENPHETRQRRFQVKFGFNVWCGIIGKE